MSGFTVACAGPSFCHVCSGGKLGLSMRDVDQATGRDLLDLEKIRAAQVRFNQTLPA